MNKSSGKSLKKIRFDGSATDPEFLKLLDKVVKHHGPALKALAKR